MNIHTLDSTVIFETANSKALSLFPSLLISRSINTSVSASSRPIIIALVFLAT